LTQTPKLRVAKTKGFTVPSKLSKKKSVLTLGVHVHTLATPMPVGLIHSETLAPVN